MTRYRIWRIRREARLLSRFNGGQLIDANVSNIRVGRFKNGREVKL